MSGKRIVSILTIVVQVLNLVVMYGTGYLQRYPLAVVVITGALHFVQGVLPRIQGSNAPDAQ